MLLWKPEDQPIAEQALNHLNCAIQAEKGINLRWCLLSLDDTHEWQLWEDVLGYLWEANYQLQAFICMCLIEYCVCFQPIDYINGSKFIVFFDIWLVET